jgi:hypothetical protein
MNNIDRHFCIQFITNPTVNPRTHNKIQYNKSTYNEIVAICKTVLSDRDIKQALSILSERDLLSHERLSKKLITRSRRSIRRIRHSSTKRRRSHNRRSIRRIYSDNVDDIVYSKPQIKVEELTDKLLTPSNIQLTTYNDILNRINDDDFITNILKSEKRFNEGKIKKYEGFLNEHEKNLNEYNKQMARLKSQKIELKDSDIGLIDDTKRIIADFKGIIKDLRERNKELDYINPVTIYKKRTLLNNLINYIESNLQGISREITRNQLYDDIINFTIGPERYINTFINTMITGSAGIGKTSLAHLLMRFYYAVGIITKDKFVEPTRQNLVGGYVGETAVKTRRYFERNYFEGVIFLDEAYSLTNCPDENDRYDQKDFGQESINEIIKFIDTYRGLGIFIVAGYQEKMIRCFLGLNEGMDRRFPEKILLKDLTSRDLFNILMTKIENRFKDLNFSINLSPNRKKFIFEIIDTLNKPMPHLKLPNGVFKAQGSDMENLASDIINDYYKSIRYGTGYDENDIQNTFKRYLINV